ncbi:DUF2066 domain-containing protein [uncultured Vibrio sp.]|uniref:DUF2066 domain-containing protein n=1 Tax=uncultured Vibrio sp. TaxID=114054 RepID=UPI00091AEE8D|nr:DUF2066 domain-containing protein [uncultured Vibrio sp.]OIQ25548.1 MAG: hypothetical protein BM561_05615 [Vibrio sp. MedPE-SWchi]
MRHLALLVVSLLSIPAYALTNVDLYRSEIIIDQEKPNGDAAARVSGMQEVIVRASGNREAVNNEVVRKALSKHSQYLSQLSYSEINEQSSLRMSFSAPHIRGLLSQAQLPYWPQSRSNLLVWLVEDSNFERNISWEHSDTLTLNRIKQTATLRGLPLTVPVGDFDDITGISISDVWGGFVEPISAASQRYPSDAVLVVRAQGNNLRWTLYDQKPENMTSRTRSPQSGSASGSNAAADMVHAISDYYAEKDAVVVASESSESVLAQFTLIDSALDFFQLEKKLKALSSVASLDIQKIQGTTVTFQVHLLATMEEFEQEVLRIAQVNKMQEVVTPSAETDSVSEVDAQEPSNTTEQPEVGARTIDGVEPILMESRALPANSLQVQSPEMEALPEDSLSLVTEEPVADLRTILQFEWLAQ